MRKSCCCVKTVLGKVFACKKNGVYFLLCSLCVQFSQFLFFRCQKICVNIVLCKGFSVAKVLCVKVPTCLYLCAQKLLCIKQRYVKKKSVKTSVCKGVYVYFFLRTNLSV